MSEAKRICISLSPHMHDSLYSLAQSHGVSLSRFTWALLLNKLLEPGTQQMLAGIPKLSAADDPIMESQPAEQD